MKKAIAVFVICCAAALFAENPHITKLIELFDVAITSPADGDVLTYSATSGKWQNGQIPIVDGPKIVFRYKQENIEGSLPLTTFFTPSEDGLYRLNVIVTTTPRIGDSIGPDQDPCAASGPGGGSVNIDYNGALFNRIPTASFFGNGSQSQTSGLIKADSGSPFRVSTQVGSCPYSFYVVVEKL
jgi:hypothetical protein